MAETVSIVPATSADATGSDEKPSASVRTKEDETEADVRREPVAVPHHFISCAKKSESDIILIPQPSNSPRDPLNWTPRRKAKVVATLFLALFVGFSAPFCGQPSIQQQGTLSGKLPGQITYFFGRSSVIFWTLFGQLAAQIWALLMMRPDQYGAYLVSRYVSALFGVTVCVLGPRYLVDMFFLHQRGHAFTILYLALNFGASAGPTFAGFIATHDTYWPVEYWWTVALTGVAIIAVFLFLEETSFDRVMLWSDEKPQSRTRNRVDTLFPGTKVAPKTTWKQMHPLNTGGVYGWDMTENAAFSFVHWIGFLVGFIYGHFVSDRIPMWLVRRSKEGVWRPEDRLHALWPTNFVLMPLELGLAVMAAGQLFVAVGSFVSIPITVNYICECFRTHTVEAALVLNSMRLFLGLSINFYVAPWITAVGVGWVYGMMAFFSVLAYLFLVLLIAWGHRIRRWMPWGTSQSEDGLHVLTRGPQNHEF
ncbi:hypothetical protein OQA88_4645 [Cercophora sp. LCS_1]